MFNPLTFKKNNNGFQGFPWELGAGNFLQSYYECGPWLLSLKIRRKIEPKEIPSYLIPCLLVIFTRQLEILVILLVFFMYQHKITFATDQTNQASAYVCYMKGLDSICEVKRTRYFKNDIITWSINCHFSVVWLGLCQYNTIVTSNLLGFNTIVLYLEPRGR